MVMMYAAGFDASKLTLGTLTMSTAGKTSIVVNLSTGVLGNDISTATSSLFFHLHDFTTTAAFCDLYGEARVNLLPTWSTVCYARALRTALRAGATTNSWVNPSHINVSISSTTGLITIAYADANFGLTWSLRAGRQILGFSADQSGATTYTGTQVPTYLILPNLQKVSRLTARHEADGIATHAAPDDAISLGFGMSRYRAPIYWEWFQQYLPAAKVWRSEALSTHPWTFEDLKQHCRGHFPFMVSGGLPTIGVEVSSSIVTADTFVFMNRMSGTRFSPSYASENNGAQIHERFEARAVAAYYHS